MALIFFAVLLYAEIEDEMGKYLCDKIRLDGQELNPLDRPLKILILYASYGDGHLQVSRALEDSFRRAGSAEVKLVDLYAETSPKFNRLVKFLYIKSYSLFPHLYGISYYATRRMRHDAAFSWLLNGFGVARLRDFLVAERPDLVVSTFPMQAMAESRRKYGSRVPSFTVMTDFDLHQRWIHPETDKFYVATRDLKREITALGIPQDHIRVTGIPLKRVFVEPPQTAELHAKFGLDPERRTVLIMAGSYGVMPDLAGLCANLSEVPGVQLAVVCGNNRRLQTVMENAFPADENVRIFGFVKEINELMSISSCLVTKPGGVTLSEALAAGLPVVLYKPVPGQERENARYLASKGAALVAADTDELADGIRRLLQDQGLQESMRRSAAELRRPDAAEAVAADILREMESVRRKAANRGAAAREARHMKNRRLPVRWWAGFLKLFQHN
jgi:processive 1,2-diacylglycerol beta-glucosyltransferase